MKTILMILGALSLMLAGVSNAQAVVCAQGVARAGCAGANGAAVVKKPVIVAPKPPIVVVPPKPVVVAPAAPRCHVVNGVRVCR